MKGHEAYLPGTRCNSLVVEAFGSDILSEDGNIDRRKLGSIVFGDQEKMNLLTSIVWPEIASLAQERINKAREEG